MVQGAGVSPQSKDGDEGCSSAGKALKVNYALRVISGAMCRYVGMGMGMRMGMCMGMRARACTSAYARACACACVLRRVAI